MVDTLTVSSAAPTPTPPGAGTAIVADFNGHAHRDWAVRNAAARQTAIWYLNNNIFVSAAFGPNLSAGRSVVGPLAKFTTVHGPRLAALSRNGAVDYCSL
jgi:hypothetical protein